MLKKILVLVFMTSSFSALALDADFSGKVRARTSASVTALGTVLDDAVGNKVLQGMLNANIRSSEAFEADFGVYSQLNGNESPMVFVGSGRWMFSDEVMLKVGRGAYQIAGGEVLGMNDHNYAPVVYDSVMASINLNKVDLEVGLLSETSGADDSLAVVSADISAASLPRGVKSLNLHVISNTDDLGAARIGGTLGFSKKGIKGSLTLAQSDISSIGKDGLLADLMVKYKYRIAKRKMVDLYGGVHFDGSAYDALNYNVHKFGGKLDKNIWGSDSENIYGYVGAKYKLNRRVRVGAQAFYFKKDAGDDAGELDVFVKYKMGDISVKAWAGLYANLDDSIGIDDSKLEVSLMTSF